jgi:D-glycero-D-manno-heptose 1,7-bisphosphate phosphatase
VQKANLLEVVKREALFLDRDGVINIDHGYVYEKEKFHFVDGIFEFVKSFYKRGFLIFVVTNQSGIVRGFYSEEEFQKISQYMSEEFRKRGVEISKIYHCPCHEDFSENCSCRKPSPEMILMAEKEFNIDLSKSLLVGDNKKDIEAGERAGISSNYLFSKEIKKNSFNSFKKIEENFMKGNLLEQ